MISITGLNRAEVLAALYNNAKAQGLGVLVADDKPMLVIEAERLLKQERYFDYIQGRVLKVDLKSDNLDTYLYNRDNGAGKAEKVIEILKAENADKILAKAGL